MNGRADGGDDEYVPPDLRSTGEFAVGASGAPDTGPPDGPQETGDPGKSGGAGATAPVPRPAAATDIQVSPVVPPPQPLDRPYRVPVTVEQPVRLPPPAPGPMPSGGVPGAAAGPPPGPVRGGPPPAPARPRQRHQPSPRALAALAGAALGLLLAGGAATLFAGSDGTVSAPAGRPPCPERACASSSAPGGAPPAAPPATRTPVAPPVAPGVAQVAYRTDERDVGYFEGTVTIVNHGLAPMTSWTLSFTYPGADIRNAWAAVLRQGGTDVVLTAAPTSPPVVPGQAVQVRIGGSGTPSMPANCRLNGVPCVFVEG